MNLIVQNSIKTTDMGYGKKLLANQSSKRKSVNIQLSWQRGQAAPRFAHSVSFEHPFNQQALTVLRFTITESLVERLYITSQNLNSYLNSATPFI